MEYKVVHLVSERPAVGLSGPMVDLGVLSRLPSPIGDWPCRSLARRRQKNGSNLVHCLWSLKDPNVLFKPAVCVH